MIIKAQKTRKGILLGSMLMTSVIAFDYFNSQNLDYSKAENRTKAAGTFLGTGRVVSESRCIDGEKVVVTEYKLFWIFTLGERTVDKVPC